MTDLLLRTTSDDYQLLDFGVGRKLERFCPYLVERPAAHAHGQRAFSQWQPDWNYASVAASNQWQPRDPKSPRHWDVHMRGRRQRIQIGDGLDLGFDPAQLLCWQWLQKRIARRYHLQELRVLNPTAFTLGA